MDDPSAMRTTWNEAGIRHNTIGSANELCTYLRDTTLVKECITTKQMHKRTNIEANYASDRANTEENIWHGRPHRQQQSHRGSDRGYELQQHRLICEARPGFDIGKIDTGSQLHARGDAEKADICQICAGKTRVSGDENLRR